MMTLVEPCKPWTLLAIFVSSWSWAARAAKLSWIRAWLMSAAVDKEAFRLTHWSMWICLVRFSCSFMYSTSACFSLRHKQRRQLIIQSYFMTSLRQQPTKGR